MVINDNEIRTAIDNARLTTRLAVIGWVFSLAMLIVTAVLNAYRGGNVFGLAVIPFGLATLFGVASMIYGMLGTAAAQEEEEKQLLARRRADTSALDVEEDVRFTSGRSFENYRRFAPYVLAVLGAVLTGLILFFTYRSWNGTNAPGISGSAIHSALIAAVMMLVSIFAGAFFIGQSRTPAFRWLRSIGTNLVAAFAVLAAAAVVSICHHNNLTAVDAAVGRVFFWLFAVLGIEFIVDFVIEFYRPRTMKETRPVFESRLLCLFTEPGGVMRNIASALDYQFGFKVSGTWLYSFAERSFFPVIIGAGILFWAFTTLHEVGPDQVGVRECFGKVVERKLLGPGIYFTLPRPFGNIRTFSCTVLHRIVIGEVSDDGTDPSRVRDKGETSRVVLWTEEHGKADDNFIVAVAPEGERSPESEAASISFVRMTVPIRYRIRRDGVFNYAYDNVDVPRTLVHIGKQAATEYLASSDMTAVMSTGRKQAEEAMKKRVQKLADDRKLGIEVVSLTILGAHPPAGEVAPAYQNVIGAMEQKETAILEAQAYAARTLPQSESQAEKFVADARAYDHRIRTVAAAESERFKTQLRTYRVMPSMFKLRSYLDFLEKDCATMRKFVVSSGLGSEVYQFNFEEKERLDLIDTDITQLTNKK